MARRIVIVGVHPRMKGGIATVVDGYMRAGLTQRRPVDLLQTASDGATAKKAVCFLVALAKLVPMLLLGRVALAHLMVASGGSLWRKTIIAWLCSAFKAPVVFHVHGGIFDVYYERLPRPLQSLVSHTLESAAAVVVLGDRWRAFVKRIAPAARVQIIGNGVASAPPPAVAASRDVVLFLGHMDQRKGIFDLVRAFDAVAARHAGVSLVCGGDGETGAVNALVASLPNLRGRVELVGWVDATAREALFARSIVLALPSYNENLPMAILEAMAAGVPAVSTDVGSIAEAVVDGVTGWIVPPGDIDAIERALSHAIDDCAERERRSRAARVMIEERFSVAAAVAAVEQLYDEVLLKPSGRTRSANAKASEAARSS